MRVLYFATRECWPVTGGARVRDFHLARELVRGGARLTYLAFASDDASAPEVILRKRLAPLGNAETILVRRDKGYSRPNLLRGLIGPRPITVLNYYSSRMAGELRRILSAEPFDVVQLEGVHLSSYIKIVRECRPAAKLVCDWHNIESELMARYGQHTANFGRRIYARRTVSLLRPLEEELLRSADAHTVCSEREREALLGRWPGAHVAVVGNGVDLEFYSDAAIADACRRSGVAGNGARNKVVFVGSMDYHANVDAARYFAEEIWPRIRMRRPDLQFVIAGSKPVAEVTVLGEQPGITVTGTVEDIRPYYRKAQSMVVPLRVGSGTRLKVLEAMAAGTPVISTTLGVEGLDIRPGEDAILADTVDAIVEGVVGLEEGSIRWLQLAANGRRTAARYDWTKAGNVLKRVYGGVSDFV